MKRIFTSAIIIWIIGILQVQLSGQNISDSNQEYYFHFYHTSFKQDITNIQISSPGSGYAIGKNIFGFDGKSWEVPKKLSELDNILILFNDSKGTLFVNRIFPLNYSKLFLYENQKLSEIKHPLGNEIISLCRDKKGTIYLGGDREFARKTKQGWKFIKYPPTLYAIEQVYALDTNKVWVRTTKDGFFFFNGVKWEVIINQNRVRTFYNITDDSFLVLGDDKIFFSNAKENRVISGDTLLKKVSAISAKSLNSIYAIGDNGFFIHFDGKKWERISTPVNESFNSISLTNDEEGFVSCDSGIIFKFSKNSSDANEFYNFGFQSVKPAQYAKDINDNYGVAIGDFNNDNFPDIYSVSIYDRNRLFINYMDKGKLESFRDEASDWNATGITNGNLEKNNSPKLQLGVNSADIDNDGFQDVFISSLQGKNKLLLNTGHESFRDVSVQRGISWNSNDRTNSIIIGDVNNDGWLDLFLVNEYSSNRLLINKGNGYFYDVTETCGLKGSGGSNGATFGDIDNDGKLDLVICNWGKSNEIFKNTSDKDQIKFEKVNLPEPKTKLYTHKSNSALLFDYNNDGLLDLFIANRGRSNILYRNNGNFSFEDVTEKIIGYDSLLSYSATAADFDNDGFTDLFITNVGSSRLYKNIRGEKFLDVTKSYAAEITGYCTGSAAGDIDLDGDMDLFAACFVNGSSTLFINKIDNHNFFLLNVEGVESNRDAIGAKVFLYKENSDSLLAFREINCGSGYSSVNSKQVHFGVPGNGLYRIEVLFPASGKKIILNNLHPGQFLFVSEVNGVEKILSEYLRLFISTIKDPEIQIYLLKLIIVLLIVVSSFMRGNIKYKWDNGINLDFHLALFLGYVYISRAFLYEDLSLSTLLPGSIVIVMVFLMHLIYDRFILSKMIKDERQRTRDKIARDLHDDLASTIGSSLIYADALQRNIDSGNHRQKELANNITTLLGEASESVTDLVWAVSPSHDSLNDLIARLRFHISNACQGKNIDCQININLDGKVIFLDDEIRKNILLIFKEALNNAFKHSKASKIIFSSEQNGSEVEIKLIDNGVGFIFDSDNDEFIMGNGLSNMKKRASEIKAHFEVESEKGNGCKILLRFKIS